MNKSELLAFMEANPVAYLATVENGAPRVRGLRMYKVGEDGILIQIWKSKDLHKQLEQNPEAELCFYSEEAGLQVRVRGKFEPVEEPAAIEQAVKDRPFLKKFIDQGQEVALFRLKNGLAHTWTMETNFSAKNFINL